MCFGAAGGSSTRQKVYSSGLGTLRGCPLTPADGPLLPTAFPYAHHVQAALAGLGIMADHRQRVCWRHVPTRRDVGGRPMRRDREHQLDLAELQAERCPCRHPQIDQAKLGIDEIEIVVEALAAVRPHEGLVRLLVMPRLVSA